MALTETLNVVLSLDSSLFRKGLSKASSSLGSFANKAKTTGRTIRKGLQDSMKKTAETWKTRLGSMRKSLTSLASPLAGLITLAGATALGRTLSSAAADFEEIESKFQAVFKETASDVRLWSESLGASVGRSKTEMLGFLSTLHQDTFVPLGFARGQAAELSKQLTQLAFDVASFNNKADADVIRDFQSALVGNTETVRKYGIVITQATLGAELLAMGIQGGVKAATEQEKVQARLNLIMKGTTDAQGDAIRTSGSFTNTIKALKAAFSDVAVELGGPLNDALKGLVNDLGGVAVIKLRLINFVDRLKLAYQLLKQGGTIAFFELGFAAQALVDTFQVFFRIVKGTADLIGGAFLKAVSGLIGITQSIAAAFSSIPGFQTVFGDPAATLQGLKDAQTNVDNIATELLNAGKAQFDMKRFQEDFAESSKIQSELEKRITKQREETAKTIQDIADRSAEIDRLAEQHAINLAAAEARGQDLKASMGGAKEATDDLKNASQELQTVWVETQDFAGFVVKEQAAAFKELQLETERATQKTRELIDAQREAQRTVSFGTRGRSRREGTTVPGFQHGGIVPGRGRPDSVLARVTPGEGIIPPDLTRALLSALTGQRGVSVTNNLSVAGTSPQSVRQQARAMLPEIERASRRGISGLQGA